MAQIWKKYIGHKVEPKEVGLIGQSLNHYLLKITLVMKSCFKNIPSVALYNTNEKRYNYEVTLQVALYLQSDGKSY